MLDSPWPAAAYRYAARQRADADRTSIRRSSARATVIGLPEMLASTVAPASAAPALGGTGTHMSSQISTCSARPGTSVARNTRSLPNGTSWPATVMTSAGPVGAGGEVPLLVELAVGREVHLGRDPEDRAPVDHDRAVVEPVQAAQRCADHEHRAQVAARLDQVGHGLLDRVEQGLLEQQVVDRVAGQAELREDRDRHAVLVTGARLGQHGGRVGGRVGDGHGHGAGGDPREALGVGREEVHGSSLPHRSRRHGRDHRHRSQDADPGPGPRPATFALGEPCRPRH